jgi:ABC-type spermidine/putrescine transport system permease subunit II
MTSRRLSTGGYALIGLLVYAMLLIPILMVVLTSFTPQSAPTLPTDGISFHWYIEVIQDNRIIDSMIVSIIVATIASIISAIVGTITAFGIVRGEFAYKQSLSTVLLLPLMISPVITGLAITQYGRMLGLPGGYPVLIIGHVILTLPYVFLIVRAQLLTFDETLEHASRTLGANQIETVFNITLPIIAPGVVTGILIAFVVSFGEFTATQFLISPGTTTVPVVIYTQIRTGLSPVISALATVLVVVMLIAAIIAELLDQE